METESPLFSTALSEKICLRSNGTLNRHLLNFFDLNTSPSKIERNDVTTSGTTINAPKELWFRLHITHFAHDRNDNSNFPIIVYFHGGGIASFYSNSIVCDTWCRRLAMELRSVIVSINYLLSSEHKLPSQYEDGFEALKFFDSNFDKLSFNANPGLCFVSRHTAGGNLAHHVAVKAGEYKLSKLKLIGLLAI